VSASPIQSIADGAQLYRSITKKSEAPNPPELDPSLFFRSRNRAKDRDGISTWVFEEPAWTNLAGVRGLAILLVSSVRGVTVDRVSLDVLQDSDDHALITGVPFYDSEDEGERLRAVLVAQQLVAASAYRSAGATQASG